MFSNLDDAGVHVERVRRAYYAGNNNMFPNLNDRLIEIESEQLLKKYNATSPLIVDRCLTKQLPYVMKTKGKPRVYNIRRINQLCMHIKYPKCEPYFLYDYEFMSNFLHCYKISKIFDRCRGSVKLYPQLRFLLKLYETFSSILDNYPDNFAFELSSRLSSLGPVLPELSYNLLQQCLNNCALRMLDNETRSVDSYVIKYPIGTVYAISLDKNCLFVLAAEKLLIYYLIGKIDEYVLPLDEFKFLKAMNNYVCLYSASSLRVYDYAYRKKCVLELNIADLIHVELIKVVEFNTVLIVCAKESTTIGFWRCSDGTLIEQYALDKPILECATIRTNWGALFKVTHQSNIVYVQMGDPILCAEAPIRIVATLDEKPGKESIFLDPMTDVYYSEGQSNIYLYHFQSPTYSYSQNIDNLPPVRSPCNRLNGRRREQSHLDEFDSALTWFTPECAVIFHSCHSSFIIHGEYDAVCEIQFSQVDFSDIFGNFVCYLSRKASEINIFEWRCDNGEHNYRLFACLQLEEKISLCVCNIGECCLVMIPADYSLFQIGTTVSLPTAY